MKKVLNFTQPNDHSEIQTITIDNLTKLNLIVLQTITVKEKTTSKKRLQFDVIARHYIFKKMNMRQISSVDVVAKSERAVCHFPINTIITRELHFITHLISSMFRRTITQTHIEIAKPYRLSLRIKSIQPIVHVNIKLNFNLHNYKCANSINNSSSNQQQQRHMHRVVRR